MDLQSIRGDKMHVTIPLHTEIAGRRIEFLAMLDSGATGNFVDSGLVDRLHIPRVQKSLPESVHAVDGKPLTSGLITEHTIPMSICTKTETGLHTEVLRFNIIDAPQYGFILGLPWLVLHNPAIDWEKKSLRFSSTHCKEHCLSNYDKPELLLASLYSIATAAEKEVELPEVYHAFLDVFDKEQAEVLPPHRTYDCQIDLVPGALLPSCRVYALSEKETQFLKEYLESNVERGFIRPSRSPAASPLIFVPKANKELRPCIDYRVLNKNTIRNRYPLPLIPVLLDQVKKANIYTRLDLRGAYYLVRMREGDEWKTAFKTQFGLFEYLVMPFGLCNAPAAFQFFLNDVLKEYLDIFVIVYIDDILIYSKDVASHIRHVSTILQTLRKHRLYCKLSKCEFHVSEVEFLGVILTPSGLVMAERKVQAVRNWPTPKTVRDVQCFLGFASYYRRFIEHFSHIVTPLTRLLRKNVSFTWSQEAEEAFVFLKRAFTSAPVLRHPDPEEPFIVEADASDTAVGAVLSQRNKRTGQSHPIAFLSRTLSVAETHYTIAEKELLAIKTAFKDWRHFLWGAKHTVTVYTDHRNLQFMKAARQLTPRQLRWMQFFAEYDFVVTFRPGAENQKADALSRQGSTHLITAKPQHPILDPAKVICVITADNFLESVKTSFLSQQWKDWVSQDSCRKLLKGLPFHGSVLFLPSKALQQRAFQWCHKDSLAGHPGIDKTIELLRRKFWWPTLGADIRRWVGGCLVCASAKACHSRSRGLLQPLPTPTSPWRHISVDFIVDLPSDQNHTVILVVVDSLTKLGHFIPCKKLPSASQLALLLLVNVVRLHGLPTFILSDRGSQFSAQFWQTWCKALGIRSCMSTSYHPQSDGQTERLNQTLKQYLRCYALRAKESWVDLLWLAELAYNNLTHRSIGTSPFYATYGFHPRTLPVDIPPDIARIPDVQKNITLIQDTNSQIIKHLDAAKRTYKRFADAHRISGPSYKPGDKVWLSAKHIQFKHRSLFNPKFIGPFVVVKRVNPVAFKLALPPAMKIHPVFHSSLLKPAPNIRYRTPPPILREGAWEYEVHRILDSRRLGGNLWYLVSWKGYGTENDSWEPASNIHAPGLVRSFHLRFPDKPRPRGCFGGGNTVRVPGH